jgi:hypothetical protein
MDVTDLMSQCNGQDPSLPRSPQGSRSRTGIDEKFLDKLAEEVRKDVGKAEG